jgi:hypothetical protein
MEDVMRNSVAALVLVIGLAACSEVFAQGVLVGVSGGARTPQPTSGAKRSQGAVTYSNDGKPTSSGEKTVAKAEMPAAIDVPELDAAAYQRAMVALNLTDAQIKKIGEMQNEIIEQGKKLAKAQTDARAAYAKSSTEKSYIESAQALQGVMAALKQYQPSKTFEGRLSSILSGEQRKKYREFADKK